MDFKKSTLRSCCVSFLLVVIVSLLGIVTGRTQGDYQRQVRQLRLYNIGIGTTIGGVGALINKHEDQKWWEALLKGAAVGTLGGWVNYESKNLAYRIASRENLYYGWAAKLTQSVGTSMIQNAASNRNFWASYHFNFGPIRFLIDERTGYRPSIRITPGGVVGLVWMGSIGRFSLGKSLQSGAPVFLTEDRFRFLGDLFGGAAVGGSTVINENTFNFYELFAHEYIHILQYDDYVGLNSFVDQPYDRWKQQSSFFRKTDQFIYYDWHTAIYSLSILSFKYTADTYFQNWYEFEAEHFATKEWVFR